MSTVHKIAKNTGIIIIGNITFKVASLFIIIYMARYFDVKDFEKYNFVFAYMSFFAVSISEGLLNFIFNKLSY